MPNGKNQPDEISKEVFTVSDNEEQMTEEELIAAYIQLVGDYAESTPDNLAQPNPNRFVQNITTNSSQLDETKETVRNH